MPLPEVKVLGPIKVRIRDPKTGEEQEVLGQTPPPPPK